MDGVVSSLERRACSVLEAAGLGDGALLVVAVSGGPDSLALLHALSRLRGRLRLRLHAAHLDHRLRGEESAGDARFVERACGDIGVAVTLDRTDVPAHRRSRGLSMEEAAREARYAFLSAVCEGHGADAVATGHTADDRAETVLMNIIRGVGLTGLRGIEPAAERLFDGRRVRLVRPLLEVSGEETAGYCRALGLTPREDRSNRSTAILRNRVRLSLMPILEEYNPAVREALTRLSVSAARDLDYVERQVDALWSGVAEEGDGYVAMDARALSETAAGPRYHLLRRAVLAVKGDLRDVAHSHLDAVAGLLAGPSGRSIDLPGGLRASAAYGELTIAAPGVDRFFLPSLEGEWTLNVPGETLLEGWRVTAEAVRDPPISIFPLGAGGRDKRRCGRDARAPSRLFLCGAGGRGKSLRALLDPESLGLPLEVRGRRPGDRFKPLGMSGTKSLQDLFVDCRVPRAWRDRVPLLVSPRGIAWVVGVRVADWARVRPESAEALEVRFERLHDPVEPR